eukprot:jgi/Botrbrau1/16107/Bobra.7_2s0071.1
MPWLTRSTAVTIIVILSGYTLLLTLTLKVPHPSNKPKAVVIEHSRAENSGKASVVIKREDAIPCVDRNDRCSVWKKDGQCLSNPSYMLENCWKACGGCNWKPLQSVPQKVKLNNSIAMPRVGFGTAGLGENTKQATIWALQAGYRMLDSAQAREWYREDLVGEALAESGLERRDVFITSKMHPRHHGYDSTLRQFEESLRDFRTNYLDLFLLHYPHCWPGLCSPPGGNLAGELEGFRRPRGCWEGQSHWCQQF